MQGDWTAASTRSVVFALGAVGGLYGLFLGARRNRTLSEQIELQSKQITSQTEQIRIHQKTHFNDSFGRAVEALAQNEPMHHFVGIDIMKGLYENSEATGEEIRLIRHAIELWSKDQFTGDQTKRSSAANYGLDTLSSFRKIHVPFAINLNDTNFQGVDFSDLDLFDISFNRTLFCSASFQDCSFNESNFTRADFSKAYFLNCDVSGADFKNAQNLTPSILAHMTFNQDTPPINLPAGLNIDTAKAYRILEMPDGEIEKEFL